PVNSKISSRAKPVLAQQGSQAKAAQPGSVAAQTHHKNQVWNGFLDKNLTNAVLALFNFGVSLFLFFQVLFWTPKQYTLPTDEGFRVLDLQPLNERAGIQDVDAMQFGSDCLDEMMNIPRLRPEIHFQGVFNLCFTDEGREETASML